MPSALSRIVTASCALSLGGCIFSVDNIPALKPEAAQVRIVNEEPEGCTLLGDVSGKATAERDPEALIQGVRNDLRNNAYAMGATHVVMQNSASDAVTGIRHTAQKAVLVGVALKCPVEQPPAGSAGPQASAAAPAPRPPPPPVRPRCRASDLPQWKDAEPYQKKKLLDYCRAPADSPDPGVPKLD